MASHKDKSNGHNDDGTIMNTLLSHVMSHTDLHMSSARADGHERCWLTVMLSL